MTGTRKGKPHPSRHGHTIGRTHSPTYQSWSSMLTRCNNPRSEHYDRYGGRGVYVCDRWLLFDNFLADMGVRPTGTTLDRRENEGGYTPENCRWADKTTQANNRSNVVTVEINGETRTLSEWCRLLSVSVNTVRARVKSQGMDYATALQKPTRRADGKLATGFAPGDPNNPKSKRR